MVKKLISIGDPQNEFLMKYAKDYDITYTEALRRMLDIGIGKLNIITNITNKFYIDGGKIHNMNDIGSIVDGKMNDRDRRLRNKVSNNGPIGTISY